MKRLLSIALSLLLVASLLVGCGNSTGAPATQGTNPPANATQGSNNANQPDEISGKITFLTNRTDLVNNGSYDKLLTKFQEKYPNVTVEFEGITDYAGELATRMQTTEYGDVLMIPDAVPSKEYGKYFVPFGTVEELGKKYQEGYLYSKWFDNQVYGLAYMCTVQGLVYNKAVFEEAGITKLPKSSEEFLAALRQIKEKTDAIPYYTNANSGWTLDQWEDHAYGTLTGNANYKNNEMPYDKKAFAEGSSHYTIAKLLYDIVKEGLCEADPTTCDWEASKLMLNNGEIACMVLGNWAIQQMKDAGENADDVGYMPFPGTVDGKQYATSGTDYCYAINKNSKNIDAARAWVDFMVDESGLALDSGGISLLKSDPMPQGLEEFADIKFIVDLPATEENLGLLSEVEYDSGITLYDNGSRLNAVVDIARGASSQTFEQYMESLNAEWSSAAR